MALVALILLYLLYCFRLDGTGLGGPDEPRYAAIGREMARSGDWITPRLQSQPWFEKPALLYWMTGAGFRVGLNDDLAPRLPVALLSVLFLAFFYWSMRREFGIKPAWFATAILATSAGWLGFSYVAVTDLPMSVFFSAAMLLGMAWLRTGRRQWLVAAAASLGLAVLAKSLVPLILAIPFAWLARRKWREMLSFPPILAFVAVALPWHVLCYLANGSGFLRTLIWEHQIGRFLSPALQHVQPVWFYVPVLAAAVFPWTPLAALLFRRDLYSDQRRLFLLLWLACGFVFFSASRNKLPGYILPLLPAVAALMGLALAEAGSRAARWMLAITVALLFLIVPLGSILPQALAVGLSSAPLPALSVTWLIPLALAPLVWLLESRGYRSTAVFLTAAAVAAAVVYLKLAALPAIDTAWSARRLWRVIANSPAAVCVEDIPRNWRYGLNYYSVAPLSDCDREPRPLHVTQAQGGPALLRAR